MKRPSPSAEAVERRRRAVSVPGLTLALLLAACGSEEPAAETASTTTTEAATEAVIDPGDGGDYQPQLDAADFVDGIDNPYLPLVPGSRWVYEGDSDGEREDIVVEVTNRTKEIEGITATVVRDTVHVGGVLVEDTYDWFAQDRDGNVWYLGEDSSDFDEEGNLVSKDGSWEYGRNGALPGIVMLADPRPGAAYRQEYRRGVAEDMGEVLRAEAEHAIGLGTYQDVVVTEEWTPLEPDVVENKWYALGVGKIYGTHESGPPGTIELVEFMPGG
jgi:hypothetical protein